MPARLKSLELQGYKTFAARTEFQFADTVTAVVGPNGSGKSNIADSIRWVLGEQSYSLLRAKKTEDMIFSGSEHRARAGMASATITFDNSDGWLPIDFSEVAITRRAYRDGQNEYMINGQRVRLKDVSELLAQSGLAERTYTIIGQGLVDAALALKAEERRRLFEEAAGIGLHRARREEALKRLEGTRHNLERVQDILAELQPRLKSLERQARRMMEYEQVNTDLHVLLRDWYGFHWHRAQKELQSAREFARVQETVLIKANHVQAEQDRQLNHVRDQVQELRDQLGQWHGQLSELHGNRESLGRRIAVADERVRSLVEQEHATLQEIGRLDDERVYYKDRFLESQVQVGQMHIELEEAQRQAEGARLALKDRQIAREKAEKALQTVRQTMGNLTARQSFLAARLDERKEQAEHQMQGLASAEQAVAREEQELLLAKERLDKATQNLKLMEGVRRNVENQVQERQQEKAAKEIERKSALDRHSALQTKIARSRAQLDILEQADRGLAGYANGTRLLLESIRQARLKGARGALSSELEVPASYEVAIAAALGEFLDAIVLHEAELDEALKILEGQDARGVLLPLDMVQTRARLSVESLQAAAEQGVIGVAAALVKASAELQPTINLLLGRVLIVKARSDARQLVRQLKNNSGGFGVKIVTLAGEVFLIEGPVLAGQEGKPGTLSRPREKRELVSLLESLEEQSGQAQEAVKLLDSDLKKIVELEGQFRVDLQKALVSEKKAAAEVNQEDVAVEKAQRTLQWQREQMARLQQEIEKSRTDTEKMSLELKKLDVDSEQIREQIRVCSNNLTALGLDEFQTQLAHWSTRAAVTERAYSDAQRQLSDRKLAVERAEKTAQNLEQRLEQIRAGLITLQKEKDVSTESERTLHNEIDAMMLMIKPAELLLNQHELELKQLQANETESRQALSQAEHLNAQAKIGLARKQEALESLRSRIEDDFGLVAFKYVEEVSGPTPLPLTGLVEQLPEVSEIPPELEDMIKRQRAQLRRMGPINPEAQSEYVQVKERYEFLVEQLEDSRQAEQDIKEVIAELDLLMEREFRKTFEAVAQEFRQIFTRLFGGGSARLVLTAPEDMTDTGIDIEARLPGRREQGLSLLSGGERSLTAAALVFSLLKVSPTPFCVFDEVDAMLDEANVGRFRDLLRELSQTTQFVVVTHNRNTVQAADVIYGVTMGNDSASQVISLKLDEVGKVVD